MTGVHLTEALVALLIKFLFCIIVHIRQLLKRSTLQMCDKWLNNCRLPTTVVQSNNYP